MDLEYLRDAAMYGAVFGFFAMVWFGWAQENPPKKLVPYLIAGAVISGLVFSIGLIVAIVNWDSGSVLGDSEIMKQYGITVGVEFALAGLGAGLLYWRKLGRYAASWVAFIVGVHFISLASVFKDRFLYILAGTLVAAVIVSILIALRKNIAISAVNGLLCGLILLAAATIGLITVVRLWPS